MPEGGWCARQGGGNRAYDTFTDVGDMEGLEADARLAKGLGYTGRR